MRAYRRPSGTIRMLAGLAVLGATGCSRTAETRGPEAETSASGGQREQAASASKGSGESEGAERARKLDGVREDLPDGEAGWRELLTEEEFRILREQGTERAHSGRYWDHEAEGIYRCAACGNPVFSSEAKFESGTGWPSYYEAMDEDAVAERPDPGVFGTRTEIVCAVCDSHLGHVFDDGPEPTGLRYCINSVALDFEPAGEGDGGETASTVEGERAR